MIVLQAATLCRNCCFENLRLPRVRCACLMRGYRIHEEASAEADEAHREEISGVSAIRTTHLPCFALWLAESKLPETRAEKGINGRESYN